MVRSVAFRVLAAAALILVACPAAFAQQPKRGGVIRIAEREAPGLDPHLSISFLTHSYVSFSYSQLVRFPNGPEQKHPADFSILPDLAEKWTVSPDGRVYTFTLRKGVLFHNKPPVNGREMVAEDVKFSLDRFMAKSGFKSRFDPVQAIDVVDKYTVRISLKEPYAPFLNHLANPSFCAILPREAEEKYKDFNHPDAVIGTGPFVLKSYDKGVKVVFERNPTYFMKGLPYLDGVVLEITPDAAARIAVLRAGKAELPHIWGWVSPEEGKSLQKTNPELSVVELAADNLSKIGITVELKPEEYGKYISTTALGKFEKMAMGPSTPFTEVDDYLFGRFYPELPTNQSHVADAELNRMLVAQRREMDPKKRKQIVDDIQRYLADKAYYVYVPQWPQYIAHPGYVKGFKPHDGYGSGMRLAFTWLDK